MSEPIPEFVSGRVYDELLGKYEFNLKQLEAAKAQFEAMNKNFSYMSDKFQEAFSMLEAEKAKSAKLREALHKLQVGCHPDSECRAIVDEALEAEVQG